MVERFVKKSMVLYDVACPRTVSAAKPDTNCEGAGWAREGDVSKVEEAKTHTHTLTHTHKHTK